MTSAALRLRGRGGPLRAEVTWPEGEPRAIVVCVHGGGEADEPDAVVVRVRCENEEDARIAVEWTRAHAAQLGVPAGRVIVR
jgi:hypothetical protein